MTGQTVEKGGRRPDTGRTSPSTRTPRPADMGIADWFNVARIINERRRTERDNTGG